MIHLPRSSYTLKPWKNGLGMTEEIYVFPQGRNDFLFRFSMAALTTSGPFSHFPGIDRTLILLEGRPVKLNDLIVPLLTPFHFPGENEIVATIETEGRDLNLMCRRGKASGKTSVVSHGSGFDGETEYCLIFALTDSIIVGTVHLNKYDSCILQSVDRNIKMMGEKFLRIDITLT